MSEKRGAQRQNKNKDKSQKRKKNSHTSDRMFRI
jgi:hypothetical protein